MRSMATLLTNGMVDPTNPERCLDWSNPVRPSLDWMAWVITEMTTLDPMVSRGKSMMWYASNVNGYMNGDFKRWLKSVGARVPDKIYTHQRLRARNQFIINLNPEETAAWSILTNGKFE